MIDFLRSNKAPVGIFLGFAAAVGWMASWLIAPAAWGAVLSVALWPSYRRFTGKLPAKSPAWMGAAIFSIGAFGFFSFAIVSSGNVIADSVSSLVELGGRIKTGSFVVPSWISDSQWMSGAYKMASESMGSGTFAGFSEIIGKATSILELFGGQILERAGIAALSFALLFVFLFRGSAMTNAAMWAADIFDNKNGRMVIGESVKLIVDIFNGIVVLGIAEGAILAVALMSMGVPNAIFWGILMGGLAAIPLAAPTVAAGVCVYIFVSDSAATAMVFAVFSGFILFVLDSIVRPLISGKGSRLSFLSMLIGFVAGIKTFGFIGIFLGPILINAMLFYWEELVVSQQKHKASKDQGE